jgi:hypothetical protein
MSKLLLSDEIRVPTAWHRPSVLLFVMLAVGTVMACGKYTEYSSTRTGTFYPNECVNLRGRRANGLLFRPDVFTVCQPVKISEVGVMTQYEPENSGNHEVARLELSNGGYYVWTSTLQRVGRIDYNRDRTIPTESLWRKSSRSFWKLIRDAGNGALAVLIVLFFFGLLFSAITSSS